MGWLRRSCVVRSAGIFALSLVAVYAGSARSGELDPTTVGSREVWVGVDAGQHNWLVYTGATYAPFGDVQSDGLRLRATTGYGNFDTRHYRLGAKNPFPVDVTKTYADASIGYQYRWGELTAKAFAGVAMLNETFDGGTFGAQQTDIGLKVGIELWLNLGPHAWSSLDLSYADTQATVSGRLRAGYRVLPTVSLGVEGIFDRSTAVANANAMDPVGQVPLTEQYRFYGTTRVGAFARYEWFGGEISASGGLSGEIYKKNGKDTSDIDLLHRPSAYGTLNFIVQF